MAGKKVLGALPKWENIGEGDLWGKTLNTIPEIQNKSSDSLYTWIDADNKPALPLDTYTFQNSSVTISPARWASIPSLVLDGVEIFYTDAKRRNNPQVAIRESFFMWPQPNEFSDEQQTKYGYQLKKHGFLRDVAWKHIASDRENEFIYEYINNEETLKQYPYPFTARLKIILGKTSARISLEVTNTGSQTMQFAPWHHTYYKVDLDKKDDIHLSIPLTEQDKTVWLSGEDTIECPNPSSCQAYLPGTGTVQLDIDAAFGAVDLRSELDKWFACIEPVTCKIQDRETWSKAIDPGETLDMWFTVTLVSRENIL